MLRTLDFANFKSWRGETRVDLGDVTALFGTNSSGKSSVLQTLLVLKQTAESLDRSRVLHLGDDRTLVDLGTAYDVFYGHDESLPLVFGVSWTLAEPLEVKDPAKKDALAFSGEDISFRVELAQVRASDSPRLVVREFSYAFADRKFGMRLRAPEDPNQVLAYGDERYDVLAEGWTLKRRPGRPWPLPAPVKNYGFPDQVANYFQNADFLDDLSLALEGLLTNISYVGPLREYPRRSYVWGGERPSSVGERGQHAVEALLAARAEGRKLGRGVGRGRRYVRFEVRIAEWLRELGLIESFVLRQIGRNRKEYEVRVRKTATSPEVLITDVGFGVSQILPVLVQCYYAPEGSLVIFEQPEIHLHPRVQSGLADVFIDAARERRVQILVESHSEHLLRRLQRRVAEEEVQATAASLYFVSVDEDHSSMRRLDMDIFGNISNWPDGFFGDELGELAATAVAASKRAPE